LKDAVFQSRT